jgi:hypothetical protein
MSVVICSLFLLRPTSIFTASFTALFVTAAILILMLITIDNGMGVPETLRLPQSLCSLHK